MDNIHDNDAGAGQSNPVIRPETEAYYCLEDRECTESSHVSSNNDNVELSERYDEVDLSEFRNIAQADRENMEAHEFHENTERVTCTVTAVQCTDDAHCEVDPRADLN